MVEGLMMSTEIIEICDEDTFKVIPRLNHAPTDALNACCSVSPKVENAQEPLRRMDADTTSQKLLKVPLVHAPQVDDAAWLE
jgi:hypothetical protein